MKSLIVFLVLMTAQSVITQRLLTTPAPQAPSVECITHIISDIQKLYQDYQSKNTQSFIADGMDLYQEIQKCASSQTLFTVSNTDDCNNKMAAIKSKSDDAVDRFNIIFPSHSEQDIVDLLGQGQDFLSNCVTTKTDQCKNDVTNINSIMQKLSGEVSITHIEALINDAKTMQPFGEDFLANCASNSDDCTSQKTSIQNDITDLGNKLKRFDVKDCKGEIDGVIDKVGNFVDTCVNNQSNKSVGAMRMGDIAGCLTDMINTFNDLKEAIQNKDFSKLSDIINDFTKLSTDCQNLVPHF